MTNVIHKNTTFNKTTQNGVMYKGDRGTYIKRTYYPSMHLRNLLLNCAVSGHTPIKRESIGAFVNKLNGNIGQAGNVDI